MSDPEAWLLDAIRLHRQQCRRDYVKVPAAIDHIEAFLMACRSVPNSAQAQKVAAGPAVPDSERMLTVRDVIAMSRLSESTIRAERKAGRLRARQIGRRVLFDPADVEHWLEGRS